jgi:hypothetical protein
MGDCHADSNAAEHWPNVLVEYLQGRMKPSAWVHALLVSALCAACIWALSPVITGHKEPWDDVGHYYPLGLVVAGLLAGLVSPRIRWAYYVGSILGQLMYMLAFLATGPLIAVGVLTMCIYGVVFLLAALLANYMRGRVVAMIKRP